MIAYLVNRIFQACFTLLAVSLVAFVMFNFVGDPVSNMVGQETTSEDYEALREKMGLNDPTIMQFGRFVANAARGNFGISYRMQRPVADIIAELKGIKEAVQPSDILLIADAMTGQDFGTIGMVAFLRQRCHRGGGGDKSRSAYAQGVEIPHTPRNNALPLPDDADHAFVPV